MSKEEVIAAVLRCATNLGRVPTREEFDDARWSKPLREADFAGSKLEPNA